MHTIVKISLKFSMAMLDISDHGEAWVITVKLGAFGGADLWSSTVTDFMSLSDPITTDRVPYGHGGLVGEAAAKVVGDHSFLEVRSATVAPLNRGRIPRDCSHDAPTRRVCTCAHSYIRQNCCG